MKVCLSVSVNVSVNVSQCWCEGHFDSVPICYFPGKLLLTVSVGVSVIVNIFVSISINKYQCSVCEYRH